MNFVDLVGECRVNFDSSIADVTSHTNNEIYVHNYVSVHVYAFVCLL